MKNACLMFIFVQFRVHLTLTLFFKIIKHQNNFEIEFAIEDLLNVKILVTQYVVKLFHMHLLKKERVNIENNDILKLKQ